MKIKTEIKNIILLILGSLLIAVTINLICAPKNYITGGLSSIGIIFNYLFKIKISYVLLIGNLFVILIGIIILGLKDTYKSIIGAGVYTLCVYLTENITSYITLDFSNVFLDIIVSGVLLGIGCTLVYLAGYTTGGADVIGLIFNKKFSIAFGKSLFIVNMIILGVGTFIFGIEMLVIALLIRLIESKIIDNFLIGISDSKVLFINTKEVEKVKNHIINDTQSGVSQFKVVSGYKNENKEMLMCVVPTEKYLLLKKEIIKIDKDVFITILDCYEVYGGTNRYKLPFHDLRD